MNQTHFLSPAVNPTNWEPLSGIGHDAQIGNFILGGLLLSEGCRWLRILSLFNKNVKSQTEEKTKPLKKAIPIKSGIFATGCAIMCAYAINLMVQSAPSIFNSFQNWLQVRKFTSDSYEQQLVLALGPSTLTASKFDPRPKAVFLAAKSDPSGALNPLHLAKWYEDLNRHYDLFYKRVESNQQACRILKKAAKKGPIDLVVYNAHGHSEKLDETDFKVSGWSWSEDWSWSESFPFTSGTASAYVVTSPEGSPPVNETVYPFAASKLQIYNQLSAECFKGLSSHAKQIALVCHAGEDDHGIAAAIARISKHPVIAPKITLPAYGLFWDPHAPQNIYGVNVNELKKEAIGRKHPRKELMDEFLTFLPKNQTSIKEPKMFARSHLSSNFRDIRPAIRSDSLNTRAFYINLLFFALLTAIRTVSITIEEILKTPTQEKQTTQLTQTNPPEKETEKTQINQQNQLPLKK